MYNKGKEFENQLFIFVGENVQKKYILGYLGIRQGLSCFPAIKFLSLNPKYDFIFFSYSLSQTQLNENFMAVRPHLTEQKNPYTPDFHIRAPMWKIYIFGFSGGGGGGLGGP